MFTIVYITDIRRNKIFYILNGDAMPKFRFKLYLLPITYSSKYDGAML